MGQVQFFSMSKFAWLVDTPLKLAGSTSMCPDVEQMVKPPVSAPFGKELYFTGA